MLDEQRLKLEPFKTMIDPVSTQTIDELRGWRPPRGAYILFESRYYDIRGREWKRGLATLNVDGRPDQAGKIGDWLRKGFRLLHYGNFLKSNSPDAKIQARITLYRGGPDKPNPWDELEKEVLREMNRKDPEVLSAQMNDINAKYQEALRLNAELMAKQGKKASNEQVAKS